MSVIKKYEKYVIIISSSFANCSAIQLLLRLFAEQTWKEMEELKYDPTFLHSLIIFTFRTIVSTRCQHGHNGAVRTLCVENDLLSARLSDHNRHALAT